MKRVIVTASGTVTLGQYARAWRAVKSAAPGTEYKSSLCHSFGGATREEILEEFAYGLHDRINRHVPGYGIGRRWTTDEHFSAWRDSRKVRDILTRRLRVYQFETKAARERFAHLLADPNDN